MRKLWIVAALLTAMSGVAWAQSQDILVMGGRNRDKFLGCLTCSEFDGNSVWNKMSTHGWENSFGTWNSFGENKNKFGSNSACNEFASNPPILVDRRGGFYGELTINEFRRGSVCGATGSAQICRALKVMCADD